MTDKVIGIFSYPWPTEFSGSKPSNKYPARIFQWAVWFKANPRNEEYMENMFLNKYPYGKFVNIDNIKINTDELESADKVILLYPDAVGIGFNPVEKIIKSMVVNNKGIYVLNGRKRFFELDNHRLSKLKIRRILEITMLAEFMLIPIFLLVTPLLLLLDSAKSK